MTKSEFIQICNNSGVKENVSDLANSIYDKRLEDLPHRFNNMLGLHLSSYLYIHKKLSVKWLDSHIDALVKKNRYYKNVCVYCNAPLNDINRSDNAYLCKGCNKGRIDPYLVEKWSGFRRPKADLKFVEYLKNLRRRLDL